MAIGAESLRAILASKRMQGLNGPKKTAGEKIEKRILCVESGVI